MENQFLIDSEYLISRKLWQKKHRLRRDPSSRKESYGIFAGNGDQIAVRRLW